MAHEHNVHDTNTHFKIDKTTREISINNGTDVIMQYDHNSERLTFEIPREIDSHDMTKCNVIQIHYINIDSSTRESNADVYDVTDIQASPDDESIAVLSWLISRNATQFAGPLNFLIKFKCVAANGDVEYVWNTAIYNGLTVSNGMDNGDSVSEEYSDILASWEARIAALEQNGTGGNSGSSEITIKTEYGSYDSSFAVIGVKNKEGIRTEPLLFKSIKRLQLAQDVPDGSTIYIVYYDLAKNPVMRVTSSKKAGFNLMTTGEYPYIGVAWYFKGTALTEEQFLSMLDIEFKVENETAKDKIGEYNFVFPKWASIHPWAAFDGVTDAEVNIRENAFSEWYGRFHALTETYSDIGLEEINMSTEYLAANADDAIPEAISSLTNGGLYMWHLPAPADDAGNFPATHYTPKILLLSGIHGDETSSVWCMWKLLEALCRNDAEYRAITLLRNFCDIYIVPLANPYGIENRTRPNENNVNINRDFNVYNWEYNDSEAYYPTEPNSQYSTRCLSWWMTRVSPNMMLDLHNSVGDSEAETGKFVQWGSSPFKAINSLIEENIMDVTPYIRKSLAPKFDAYHHRYGHTKEYSANRYKLGWSTLYAAEQGIYSATYEVVRYVRWDGQYILSADNESEICAMNFHGAVNFIVKFVQYVVEMLNNGADLNASINWIADAE